MRIVGAEQARNGASQRLADHIAKPLVPAIMITAAFVAMMGSVVGDPATWIERALVVLVAASPCALAISVPVTVGCRDRGGQQAWCAGQGRRRPGVAAQSGRWRWTRPAR